MKKILTLTDFSTISNFAIDAALVFAKKHNADLVIYHVLKSSDHIVYEFDSAPELVIRNRKNKIINTNLDLLNFHIVSSNAVIRHEHCLGIALQRQLTTIRHIAGGSRQRSPFQIFCLLTYCIVLTPTQWLSRIPDAKH